MTLQRRHEHQNSLQGGVAVVVRGVCEPVLACDLPPSTFVNTDLRLYFMMTFAWK